MTDEKPSEKLSEQQEKFVPAVFLTEIGILAKELLPVIEHMQHIELMDEEAIAVLLGNKQKITEKIFEKLAYAYKATGGEVCEWPYFKPQYSELYIDLHLPYSGYPLWAKVIKWIEEQEEEARFDEEEGFYDELRLETAGKIENTT